MGTARDNTRTQPAILIWSGHRVWKSRQSENEDAMQRKGM